MRPSVSSVAVIVALRDESSNVLVAVFDLPATDALRAAFSATAVYLKALIVDLIMGRCAEFSVAC